MFTKFKQRPTNQETSATKNTFEITRKEIHIIIKDVFIHYSLQSHTEKLILYYEVNKIFF